MPKLGPRLRRAARVVAPLVMLAGTITFLASPAGAMDMTTPGQTLHEAPPMAITRATGIQPATLDPGTSVDNTPACATVDGETDPIQCLPIIRWATAMQMSDTVAFNVTQPVRSIEVSTIEKTSFTTILMIGNMAWLIAALIVNAVTNYQVNAQMVKPLNDFAAAFGASIIDSGAIYRGCRTDG